MTAKEWAEALRKRVRRSILNPSAEIWTEEEQLGSMDVMVPAVNFPLRWVEEIITQAQHEAARDSVRDWRVDVKHVCRCRGD